MPGEVNELIPTRGAKTNARDEHAGQRTRGPAAQLVALGMKNLAPFASVHHRLDVDALLALCAQQIPTLSVSDFTRNPGSPERLPRLELQTND